MSERVFELIGAAGSLVHLAPTPDGVLLGVMVHQ